MSLADLTRVVLGDAVGMDELLDLVGPSDVPHQAQEIDAATRFGPPTSVLRVGSIGYERFPLVADFARHLRERGIQRLIDVRDLPLSRRRGFAKTALSMALSVEGIEYVHMKGLGNPKRIRDLYKAGHRDDGRRLYTEHLAREGDAALESLIALVRERSTALMCVEHDCDTCHRQVIFEALRDRVDAQLEVTELGEG